LESKFNHPFETYQNSTMKYSLLLSLLLSYFLIGACVRNSEKKDSESKEETETPVAGINDTIDFSKIPISKDSIDLTLFNMILEYTSYTEPKLLENIEILITKGANPNAVIEYQYSVRKLGTYIPIIKYFYNNKYRTYTANSTAFHEAINTGNINIVKKMIDLKADVNAPSRSGVYPVDVALSGNHMDILKFLKEKGCKFEYANLSISKDIETIEWMVKEGANPQFIDINFALDHPGTLKRVLSLKPDMKTQKLDYAKVFSTELILDMLLEAGIGNEVRGTFPDDAPLVYGAIKYGTKKEVLKLKNAGINIHADCKHCSSETPLILVIKQQNIELLDFYLMEEKVSANQKDWTGRSLLHYAIDTDNEDIIKKLIKAGASLEYSGYFDKSPLMYAVDYDHYISAQVLINEKANLNFKNKYGETPLSIAIKKGSLPMVKLLVECGADKNVKIEKMSYVEYAKSVGAANMIIEYLSK
jgi:ankyrin repeat protein